MSKQVNPHLLLNLMLWGAWRRGDVPGLETLGHPSMTAEARIYTSPGRGSISHLVPRYMGDRRAQWVDRRIMALRPAKLGIALWCEYSRQIPEAKFPSASGVAPAEWPALLEAAERAAASAMRMRYHVYTGDPMRWREKKA